MKRGNKNNLQTTGWKLRDCRVSFIIYSIVESIRDVFKHLIIAIWYEIIYTKS